jgi:hypothetical protein
MAGGVFLISAISAFFAARNRRGPGMWNVAVACSAFAVIQGWALAEKYAPPPRWERDPVRRVSNHSRLSRKCAARRASGRALRSRSTLGRAPRLGTLVLSPLTRGAHLPLPSSQRQPARSLPESKRVALNPQHSRIENRLSMLSPSSAPRCFSALNAQVAVNQ